MIHDEEEEEDDDDDDDDDDDNEGEDGRRGGEVVRWRLVIEFSSFSTPLFLFVSYNRICSIKRERERERERPWIL